MAANKLLEGRRRVGALHDTSSLTERILADITAARHDRITNNVALHARDWGQVLLRQTKARRHDFML